MPGGFNHSALRDYLEHKWGLGPSRQAAVLLFAITEEPPLRIPTLDIAKKYIDSQVSRYAAACGIVLQAVLPNTASSGTTTNIDASAIKVLRKEQNELHLKHFRLLADQLQIDSFQDSTTAELEQCRKEFQSKLDLWYSEFSEDFESRITPLFDHLKARRYNSWWNLVRQDIIKLYHDLESGKLQENDPRISTVCHHIANRTDKDAEVLIQQLVSKDSIEGNMKGFSSVGRGLVMTVAKTSHSPPVFRYTSLVKAPKTTISADGSVENGEVNRFDQDCAMSYPNFIAHGSAHGYGETMPYVHIKRKQGTEWKMDTSMTDILLNSLSLGTASGISFAGKDVLVTGAGPGSIGAEVVRGLLMGGARVIVTTSRTISDNAHFCRSLYDEYGARGSELVVLPFNQGSARDCEDLISYVFSDTGLARSLDAILPFAAVSEVGTEVDSIDSKSELAHRIMLVNVLRLLGCIVRVKRERKILTRPTQVLLPLSPNHGTFGGDGLYSESKLGLEGLMNRFQSENWSDFLLITGVVIGWTRSTGLMSENDMLAETVEAHGVITFTQKEMAFNILALLTDPIIELCETEPLWADLNGGLDLLPDLKKILVEARSEISLSAEIRKAIKDEDDKQRVLTGSALDSQKFDSKMRQPKHLSTLEIGFPRLPDHKQTIMPLRHLEGMVDPASTIVIVGFSEIGPWGSARTRWEMEAHGRFSQEGYIEMAWMMNKIKHFDGDQKGMHYVGWVDAVTGERVHDSEIPLNYGRSILEHSGIRIIEPDLFGGYDPSRKEFLHEVAIEEDLPEFDATLASAEAFKLRHGNNVSVKQDGNEDEYKVRIKAGAHIMVPKAIPLDSIVAGQIPTGWDATKYGIPEDLISQVDPVTLYVLCCACECLYSAGIVDSFEIFKHIHVSELGNFIGTAMGGTTKTRQMYKDRYLEKSVQGDVLQETYLNTSAAWMNMLLLGSAGPIKTPSGTCATGVESLDSACESILAGKTKMCFVGGVDDFQEDESYGFATMKATVNTKEEFAKGRVPGEMSRPMTDSRAGFVESQGCGIQLITTAELALKMGLPIYGIIASSTMAADKIGRSVPAPGQGVLTFARESPAAALSPLLDIQYRREQLEPSIECIRKWRYRAVQKVHGANGTLTPDSSSSEESKEPDPQQPDAKTHALISAINSATETRIKEARTLWGNDFRRQNPDISPLRASLAVWGLQIDDIDVVSMHGTSTKANDKNETDVINKQMRHLGRTPGRPLFAVCQKSLTGHPKAPAASWMLNGCLQAINSGIIPGNRNADNVDEELRKFEHVVFPTKSLHTTGIKAFMLDSFGFGQKGGQVVGVAPQYFFASLTRAAFDAYAVKVSSRKRVANHAYIKAMNTNTLFKPRASPPYDSSDESSIYMDPFARVSLNRSREELYFDGENLHPLRMCEAEEGVDSSYDNASTTTSDLSSLAQASREWIEATTRENESHNSEQIVTVGIDVEELSSIGSDNQIFINRNFTVAEQELSNKSPNPQATYAGKWSAKEAVFKSFGVSSKGAGAPMKDIEILSHEGIPTVKVGF